MILFRVKDSGVWHMSSTTRASLCGTANTTTGFAEHFIGPNENYVDVIYFLEDATRESRENLCLRCASLAYEENLTDMGFKKGEVARYDK